MLNYQLILCECDVSQFIWSVSSSKHFVEWSSFHLQDLDDSCGHLPV